MDIWEIITIVLIPVSVLLVLNAVRLVNKYSKLDPTPSPSGVSDIFDLKFLSPLYDFIKVWFSLFPYVTLLGGPVIDIVTTQFMYTKASIVGIVSVILTAVFGSSNFASISEKIIDILPRVWTPFSQPIPDGVTWLSQVNFLGVFIWIVLGAVVFLPMMIGKLSGWASASSISIASLFIIIALSGNNWLGNTTFTPKLLMPGRSSTSTGITQLDICTTPGLEYLQTVFAPVGILLNTSILTSHMWESLDTGNKDSAIGSGVLTGVAFLIEFFRLSTSNCQVDYKYKLLSPFISLALGTGFGYGGYQLFKSISKESFTSSSKEGGVFHPTSQTTTSTSSGKKDTTIETSGESQECSKDIEDGDYELVGELFKDGELITSSIVD